MKIIPLLFVKKNTSLEVEYSKSRQENSRKRISDTKFNKINIFL